MVLDTNSTNILVKVETIIARESKDPVYIVLTRKQLVQAGVKKIVPTVRDFHNLLFQNLLLAGGRWPD
jgi:hypothetical protein